MKLQILAVLLASFCTSKPIHMYVPIRGENRLEAEQQIIHNFALLNTYLDDHTDCK